MGEGNRRCEYSGKQLSLVPLLSVGNQQRRDLVRDEGGVLLFQFGEAFAGHGGGSRGGDGSLRSAVEAAVGGIVRFSVILKFFFSRLVLRGCPVLQLA